MRGRVEGLEVRRPYVASIQSLLHLCGGLGAHVRLSAAAAELQLLDSNMR